MVISGKADNAVQLTRQLKDIINVECNAQTVRRALKEAGLKASYKKKKPRLLPRHIRQRRVMNRESLSVSEAMTTYGIRCR